MAKGSTNDAVAMDISVSGTSEGVVYLTKGYTGTGRVAIWNTAKTATISQVNVTDCPIRLWVQGTTESSAIPDVTVTATLKISGQTKDTDSDTVTVVKVDKVQYQSGANWVDVPETLYVAKGSTVTFKAVPAPAAASWPSDKPVWGGTAGATGGGTTKEITFNTVSTNPTDFKTVTAECGNTVTANVIVVEVGSLTPDEGTEVDDGDANPNTKWYVLFVAAAGNVTVTATPNPVVSEANLPSDWTLTGGTGTGKLTRTVVKTTPANTTITCTAGTSSKQTTITVVKLSLRVYKNCWGTGDYLSENDKENPGLYTNVNWDDDDGDGWTNNETPPNAAYTPDKDDDHVFKEGGGGTDDDQKLLYISVDPAISGKVKITFPSKVKVYETLSKKKFVGEQWVSAVVTSGTEFDTGTLPPYLFLEGQSGSASFRDVEVKIQLRVNDQDVPGVNDRVMVTVFEVTDLTGIFGFGNQSTECDKKFSTWTVSSDKCGKISWDDANADGTKGDNDANCEYFHNCMECRGTVKPADVTTQVEFHWLRDLYGRSWQKKGAGEWGIVLNLIPWQPDNHDYHDDEDNTPSSSNNYIYQIDGPGLIDRARTPDYDYRCMIRDFRERARVKIYDTWYQCSDFYKWHSKVYTTIKDANDMTRHALDRQLLGTDWVTIPANPENP